jgi:hypothetical protein
MIKVIVAYVLALLVFGAAIYGVLVVGSHLPPGQTPQEKQHASAPALPHQDAPDSFAEAVAFTLLEHLRQPLGVLVLQVIVVVAAATLVGGLFRRMGQPPVIGEMVAGILLGPSLLGLVSPETQTFLFPPQSLGGLHLISQIGVILFMFVVGALYSQASFHATEIQAQVAAEVTGAAKLTLTRRRALDSAERSVRETLDVWRLLRKASFGMVGERGRFDPVEGLFAEQNLSRARQQYLTEVIEYNKAQFRL